MPGSCCTIGDAFPQVGKSGGAWITQALLLGMGSLTAALPIISASFVAVVGGWIAAVASMGRQMEVRSLNVSSRACWVQALGGPGRGEVCLLLASGGAQGLGFGGVQTLGLTLHACMGSRSGLCWLTHLVLCGRGGRLDCCSRQHGPPDGGAQPECLIPCLLGPGLVRPWARGSMLALGFRRGSGFRVRGGSNPRAHPACLHGVSFRPVLAHASCWTPGAHESGLCSAALTPRCTGPSGLPAGSPG